MQVHHSSTARVIETDSQITKLLESVSETYLREVVQTLSMPRHFVAESRNNRYVAEWIADRLRSYGYQVNFQGAYANVVAFPAGTVPSGSTPTGSTQEFLLIGAHYDSVPETPGADDNASAVAALLGCAKAMAEHNPAASVCFVAFNREEDGLLGSADFVANYLPGSGLKISQAHILEMVGYCDPSPGSQHLPPGLPIKITDVGNFLGLIGNQDSNPLIDGVLEQAKSYLPDFPVVGLKVPSGLEKLFPHLRRSDHGSFWEASIPALMWTDTSEFRNPNYHQPTDTPDTLDYSFLRRVAQLLFVQALMFSGRQTRNDHAGIAKCSSVKEAGINLC